MVAAVRSRTAWTGSCGARLSAGSERPSITNDREDRPPRARDAAKEKVTGVTGPDGSPVTPESRADAEDFGRNDGMTGFF
jgi:hypothetical protein